VKNKSVHQKFQQRPGRDANEDQIEAIHASQVHEITMASGTLMRVAWLSEYASASVARSAGE